jgi:HSP20 family protein
MWLDVERGLNRNFWNSLRQARNLQEHLDSLLSVEDGASCPSFPFLRVWVSEHSALVEVEVAGVEPSEVELSVMNEALTLKGERGGEKLAEGETFHRQERGTGQFAKTIQLPFKIDAEKVEANFNNGLLSITLPRAEEDKPKKITVTAQG